MPVSLSVPNIANTIQTTQVDGVVLGIKYVFMERTKEWVMSIYTNEGVPIIQGAKIQPNIDLFGKYAFDELPDGVFVCAKVDKTDEPLGRDNFGKRKSYRMLFFSSLELS